MNDIKYVHFNQQNPDFTGIYCTNHRVNEPQTWMQSLYSDWCHLLTNLVIRKMARLHIESFSESHLFSVFLGCLYKCNCHIRCYINVDELMNSAFGLLCNIFFQFLQNLLIWNNNYYRNEYNKIHTHAA